MSKSDNFNEKQLKVLEIYVELELIKFSKKKKDFRKEAIDAKTDNYHPAFACGFSVTSFCYLYFFQRNESEAY